MPSRRRLHSLARTDHSSIHSWQSNIHSFQRRGMERPAGSRHSCVVTRSLQTAPQDISVLALIPWHCQLTYKLCIFFYTCVELAITSLFSSRCSVLHYGSVAPCFAMILQKGRFWAVALASRRSMSNSFRSSATLRSQVERGRPGGLLQFSAGCSNRRRHMSAESSIRATCPKSERRRDRTINRTHQQIII